MQKILILDNYQTSQSLLGPCLAEAGFRVWTAHDREMAIQVLHHQRPDMLVFNLLLPDHKDWDLIHSIQADPSLVCVPIMMIAARANDDDKIYGLEIGVDDFLIRPISSHLVIARVKSLLRRCNCRQTVIPRVLHTGDLTLDPGWRELRVDGQLVDLTQAEFGILRILMGNPGKVFTRDELVENALGSPQEGKGRALDTHIKNLRQKIEVDPHKPIHIQTIYGVGYKLMAD